MFEGTKESFDVVIEFRRNAAGTPLHNVSGEIFGEVQPNVLGLLS